MKRETLTSVLYYTLITIGILTTVVLLLHAELPNGFFLVNSILKHQFFTVDANTTNFHIVVISIVTVASWSVYAVALTACLMFPWAWGDIYNFLSFLYPEHKTVGNCASIDTESTEASSTLPVEYDKIFVNMPAVEPDKVFTDNDASDTFTRCFQSTITDLPHVARVISGTEPSNRILYVYNVQTGECDCMSEREFYSKTKKD